MHFAASVILKESGILILVMAKDIIIIEHKADTGLNRAKEIELNGVDKSEKKAVFTGKQGPAN
ncbi:MAG: hypothetical protein FJW56_06510 [Actinobacteria bacterium]|nr:hypothetical protein [Actinomycetota bacterium]